MFILMPYPPWGSLCSVVRVRRWVGRNPDHIEVVD
nr:MAG TPA: hypothetical protein [Caudoviricetes sp.]